MTQQEIRRQLKLEKYLEKESEAKSFKNILQVKKMIVKALPEDAQFTREDIIWMFEHLQEKYKEFEEKERQEKIKKLNCPYI